MSSLNILHPVLHERTSRHLFCALFVEYYSDQIPEQFYLTNRAALTVLCSVVKHAESGQSIREVQGETRDVVFFSTRRYYLPARFFRNFTFNQRKKAREKSQKRSDNLADSVTALARLYARYSHSVRSFNLLYPKFIIKFSCVFFAGRTILYHGFDRSFIHYDHYFHIFRQDSNSLC